MQSDIFNCEHCGNLFNRREHYQRHLLTHTKERPFVGSTTTPALGTQDILLLSLTTYSRVRNVAIVLPECTFKYDVALPYVPL